MLVAVRGASVAYIVWLRRRDRASQSNFAGTVELVSWIAATIQREKEINLYELSFYEEIVSWFGEAHS